MAFVSKKLSSNSGAKLNKKDLLFMALGSTIGAGIITNTGIAIGMTGRSVILAYFLSFLVMFIGNFPVLLTSTVHPVASPQYVLTEWISPKLSGFYIYTFLLGRLAQAYMGVAFGTYISSICDVNPSVAAVAVLTLFYIINLFGVKNAAKIQNITTFILIISIMSFVVLGLPKVDFANYFAPEEFMTDGWLGVFNAVAILLFGVGGASTLVQLAPDTENPKKNIPIMTIVSYIVACFIFMSVAFVGAGVAPVSEIAGQPMTYQSTMIYPGQTYLIFVIGGALLAIVTTINGNYVAYYTGCIRGVEDGWLPTFLAKRNRYDIPWPLHTLFWLMAIIPNIMGMEISQLSSLASAVTIAPMAIPLWGFLMLPKKDPEAWAKSRLSKIFRTQASRVIFTAICTAALLVFVVINFMNFTRTTLILAVGYMVVVTLIAVLFGDKLMQRNRACRAAQQNA